MIDEFLQQLSEEGQLDSRGTITLDPVKAREKLAQYRLPHAAEGTLAVLGAALLAGSQRLEIRVVAGGLEILSDRRVARLEPIFAEMFSDDQEAAEKELAFALNSLYPRDCAFVSVDVAGQTASFEGAEWVVRTGGALPEGFAQRVVLRRPNPWKEPLRWLRSRRRPFDDLKLLRSRACFCPVPVQFPGSPSRPPALPARALAHLVVESPRPLLRLAAYAPCELFCWTGEFGGRSSMRGALLPDAGDRSSVVLHYRGLAMGQYRFQSHLLAFEGVVNTEVVDLDLSRQKVLNNGRLGNLLGQMRTWIGEALAAWLRTLSELDAPFRQRLCEMIVTLGSGRREDEVFQALMPLPLLEVAGRILSIREMDELVRRFDGLHWSRHPGWLHERPVVPRAQGRHFHWPALATRLGWRRVHVAPFQERLWPKTVSEAEAVLTWTLQGDDWRAEIRLTASPYPVLFYRKGEPFVAVEEPLFPGLSLQVRLDGEFNDALDNAERRLLNELRGALWEECPRILAALQADCPHRPGFQALCLSSWKRKKRKPPQASNPSEPAGPSPPEPPSL